MEVNPMGEDRLPCGVAVDDLFDQIADGAAARDPQHQAHCPHCRATLAELLQLWSPLQALAAERVQAPPGLVAKVMRQVRALGSSVGYALLQTERGVTRVAVSVLAAVARLEAQSVPGVALALGPGRTLTGASTADVAGEEAASTSRVGVAGTSSVIDLDIAVQAGASIPELADRVRTAIRHRVTATTGAQVHQVNITVIDVIDEA
jgi:uncharacterized alkaline shock family protein YloU